MKEILKRREFKTSFGFLGKIKYQMTIEPFPVDF
jgi:hypothetical protein